MYGWDEKCIQNFDRENPKERGHLGDVSVDGRGVYGLDGRGTRQELGSELL
jgi:hypothetical protein